MATLNLTIKRLTWKRLVLFMQLVVIGAASVMASASVVYLSASILSARWQTPVRHHAHAGFGSGMAVLVAGLLTPL